MVTTTTDVIGLADWVAVKPPYLIEKNCNGQKIKVYKIEAILLTELSVCPRCDSVYPAFKKNGPKNQWVKHTQTLGFPTELHFKRQRYKCENCFERKEKTYTFLQPLSGIDERHHITLALMEHLKTRSFPSGKAFLHIGDETGMSERMVRTIYKEHTEQLKDAPPARGFPLYRD